MSAVIFHWETPKGFESYHAKKKLLARWTLTCKAFGINTLYCVSKESLKIQDAEINFRLFTSLEEALKNKVGDIVYIEQGGTDIEKFNHPENATYVFGSDYGGLSVEGAISINSILPIHAEIAVGIILSHRFLQWH